MGNFRIFVLVGGAAALVNVVARILLGAFLSFEVAVVIAFLVAMTFAFLMNRQFVFTASDISPASQFMRFALVNAVALVQVWLISVGLARYLFPAVGFQWHAETIAHLAGVASPVVTSYFLHKNFSFPTSS